MTVLLEYLVYKVCILLEELNEALHACIKTTGLIDPNFSLSENVCTQGPTGSDNRETTVQYRVVIFLLLLSILFQCMKLCTYIGLDVLSFYYPYFYTTK